MKSIYVIVLAATLPLAAASGLKAESPFAGDVSALARLPVSPAVVFGADSRETVEQFALHHDIDPGQLRRLHAASGIIRCGNARGAGQLTLADNVVTTAAHVFFNEAGTPRADSSHCRFVVAAGGEEIETAIDVSTIVAGSTHPYDESAVHDWAVARLRRPLREATPYPLGDARAGDAIRFVARGHSDWGGGHVLSLENCHLRDSLDAGVEGTREYSFDCAAGLGASGGAVMNGSGSRLLAIFVGFRSPLPERPMAFSPVNYNFAVTIEGAFRRAIEQAAALERAAEE